jgi:predicted Zn-dependent protease
MSPYRMVNPYPMTRWRRSVVWLVAFTLLSPSWLAPRRAQAFDLDRGAFEQGLEVALAVQSEIGLIDDEAALGRIYDLGARIAYAAGDDETVYSFYIVDMPEPNAFAVPGGFIFITQGMLEIELDDDPLAHLLGHEVIHVRNRHASQIGFWSTIASLLQTAVVIGVAAVASGSRPVTYEDEYGREYTRVGGGGDAIASASVVSTVFREFFLRGYSRGLETEADEDGARLATAAGFPAEGGVDMLESLHARVYEGGGYSYWRTHPYFNDRVAAARTRLWRPATAPDSTAIAAFRSTMQERLAELARNVENEDAAMLLYRNALRWGASVGEDVRIQLELIRFRLTREGERKLLERQLGPIAQELHELERLLEAEAKAGEGAHHADLFAEVRRLHGEVDEQLGTMLPGYKALLDAPGAASNDHLHGFVLNFPDHPRAAEARLMLARRLMRAGRTEDAVPELQALLASAATPDSLRAAGRAALTECTRTVTDPVSCYAIIDAPPDSAIAELARARMDTLTAELDDLETGGRFLKRWKDTPYTEEVRARVEELAWAEERFGRVFEAGGKPQRALDIYNRVVLLAPDSEAAAEALRGIRRIQELAEG